MNSAFRKASTLLSAIAVALVSACGGGGGATAGGGTEGTGAPISSFGVMTSGSVIVNGIRFDDTTAVIRIDDRAGTPAELRDGMRVKVRGRVNDDGVTGRADRIEVENELRGLVTVVNAAAVPPQFTAGGQIVYVDTTTTVFANVAGVANLVASTSYVEVHGIRDAAGRLQASRVELQSFNAVVGDELRGTVSGYTPGIRSFTLAGVLVSYTQAATFTPAGSSEAQLANGVAVEVHGTFGPGGTSFVATRIDFEDAEDSSLNPAAGDRNEIEGYVVALNTTLGTFTVDGRAVSYSSATQFRGGALTDLANGVRVEVDGSFSGGTLVAREISFKQARAILTSVPTNVDMALRRITLLGQTVQITDLTEFRAPLTNINSIVAGTTRIEVRGYAGPGGVVIAERVETNNSNKDTVQGVVTAKDPAASTMVVLGVPVSLSAAVFSDVNGAVIPTAAAFFAAVTTDRTVVKVKGTAQPLLGGGVRINAEEAEIEN